MGLLRVLLALSVALSHLGDFRGFGIAGGFAAVQMFYMISGFYMATILTGKYDPRRDIAVFYSNRLLRIYSIYLVCLLISLAAYIAIYAAGQGGWLAYVIANIGRIDGLGRLWLAFTSIAIVGQESTLFLELKDGALAFTPNGPGGETPVWVFMPIPQAWSISLELMFYALVPFLIRNKTNVLIGIVAAALVARVAVYAAGYDHDPWLSRFFPFELALFVLGMIARRIYDSAVITLQHRTQVAVALAFVILTCAVRELVVDVGLHVVWVYYAAGLIGLPCLFAVTRHSKADQFLGSFSYPLYLIHWTVMMFYDAFAVQLNLPATGSVARAAICVTVSLVVSWIVVVSVEAPLDRYRQKRLLRMQGRPPAFGAAAG